MRISDWSSDVCSSDLYGVARHHRRLRRGLTLDDLVALVPRDRGRFGISPEGIAARDRNRGQNRHAGHIGIFAGALHLSQTEEGTIFQHLSADARVINPVSLAQVLGDQRLNLLRRFSTRRYFVAGGRQFGRVWWRARVWTYVLI